MKSLFNLRKAVLVVVWLALLLGVLGGQTLAKLGEVDKVKVSWEEKKDKDIIFVCFHIKEKGDIKMRLIADYTSKDEKWSGYIHSRKKKNKEVADLLKELPDCTDVEYPWDWPGDFEGARPRVKDLKKFIIKVFVNDKQVWEGTPTKKEEEEKGEKLKAPPRRFKYEIAVYFGDFIPDELLDGVLGDEWDDASKASLMIGSYRTLAYLKHDGQYLYIALEIDTGKEFRQYSEGYVWFDNDDGKEFDAGDDIITVEGGQDVLFEADFYYMGKYDFRFDPEEGGMNNAWGIGAYDPEKSSYVFEFLKELNSGDSLDVPLGPEEEVDVIFGFVGEPPPEESQSKKHKLKIVARTPKKLADELGDWIDWESREGIQGPDYIDIVSAGVTQVGSDLVFTMELDGNIPYPETFIPGVSELEYFFALCPLPGFEEWPWYSPAYDGLECVPNAFGILMYEDGSWRFNIDYSEGEKMKMITLPKDNLHVEENIITMKVPIEELGNPSSFKWLAGTYADGIADIAPNEGAGTFEFWFE